MRIDTIVHGGRERVVMDVADYPDIVDARELAIALRQVKTGEMETIVNAEVADYLSAPTPLAFWRKKRGYTQDSLAAEVGLSQPYVAQRTGGQRIGDVTTLPKPARLPRLRIDDLVEEV